MFDCSQKHGIGKRILIAEQTLSICEKFIEENKITCVEVIYQYDLVSENSLEFIQKLCDLIGYLPNE